jgi:hypothetical protein
MESVMSEVRASSPRTCGFVEGTDGIRATGLKHAIEHRDTDGSYGLPTGKGPCPNSRANVPFLSDPL